MADITQYPDLAYFQWSRPDDPNPRLTAPISATDTTLNWSAPPLDEDGKIVAKAFLMGIKNENGYTETVYIAAGKVQGNGNVPDSTNLGLSCTDAVRGINLAGLDFTTGSSDLAAAHGQDSPVFGNISALIHQGQVAVYQGTVASGGTDWKMGDDTDVDITVYAYNGDANLPYWAYDASGNQWVFSNDGITSTPFGTGAGVTGGDGISVTAGTIAVDLGATPALEFTGAGSDKLSVMIETDEGLELGAGGGLQIDRDKVKLNEDVVVTATSTEVNQALDGISADVTDTNLNTLVAGAASDADALHTHNSLEPTYLLGTQLFDGDWMTFQVLLDSANYGWTMANSVVFNLNTGHATTKLVNAGAANADASFVMYEHGNVQDDLQYADGKGLRYKIFGCPLAAVDGDMAWGFGHSVAANAIGARFFWDDSETKIYAVTGTGAAETATDITGALTIESVPHVYEIYYNGSTACYFYIDGSLVATHTTNLPVAATDITVGWRIAANGDNFISSAIMLSYQI